MRRWFIDCGLLILSWMLTAGALLAGEDGQSLKPGDPLPGQFQVYMATGPRAGMFHSPVGEYDLNPAVLVFIRDVEDVNGAVMDFLKKLEAAMTSYPQARMGACAIIMNDGGYRKLLEAPIPAIEPTTKIQDLDFTKAIEAKDDKVKVLKTAAKDLKLLTIGLGSVGGPEKYGIPKDADITVLVYYQQQVLAMSSFKKADFNQAAAEPLVKKLETTAQEIIKQLARRR